MVKKKTVKKTVKKVVKKVAPTKASVVKGNAAGKLELLHPVKKRTLGFTIVGVSPLIQHQWSEKSLRMMREKQAGKKTKNREPRNPDEEGEAAAYRTVNGEYGIPVTALKTAIISAAHKDLGIEKTLVKKALFIPCDDPGNILVMDCDEPEIVEDVVRVGMGSADLRYRPYFYRWSVYVKCQFDEELLTADALMILVDRAGFGVGIGEWRPEKGGEFGRFEIDTTAPVEHGI